MTTPESKKKVGSFTPDSKTYYLSKNIIYPVTSVDECADKRNSKKPKKKYQKHKGIWDTRGGKITIPKGNTPDLLCPENCRGGEIVLNLAVNNAYEGIYQYYHSSDPGTPLLEVPLDIPIPLMIGIANYCGRIRKIQGKNAELLLDSDELWQKYLPNNSRPNRKQRLQLLKDLNTLKNLLIKREVKVRVKNKGSKATTEELRMGLIPLVNYELIYGSKSGYDPEKGDPFIVKISNMPVLMNEPAKKKQVTSLDHPSYKEFCKGSNKEIIAKMKALNLITYIDHLLGEEIDKYDKAIACLDRNIETLQMGKNRKLVNVEVTPRHITDKVSLETLLAHLPYFDKEPAENVKDKTGKKRVGKKRAIDSIKGFHDELKASGRITSVVFLKDYIYKKTHEKRPCFQYTLPKHAQLANRRNVYQAKRDQYNQLCMEIYNKPYTEVEAARKTKS